MASVHGTHGWVESGPDGQGRYRFELYWLREGEDTDGTLPRPRGQHFHAHVERYPHVTWHETDASAQRAAWSPR